MPELTEGNFEHTTLTRQLGYLNRLVGDSSAVLLGSSMGGFLAALFAARNPQRIPAVVLMAPAFGLAQRWSESLEPDVMRQWQAQGWRAVFHYGENREGRIGYELIADGLRYEEFPDVRVPALVFHGRSDEAVEYRLSERFARNRPNVALVLHDSGHELLNVLEAMWAHVRTFVNSVTSGK